MPPPISITVLAAPAIPALDDRGLRREITAAMTVRNGHETDVVGHDGEAIRHGDLDLAPRVEARALDRSQHRPPLRHARHAQAEVVSRQGAKLHRGRLGRRNAWHRRFEHAAAGGDPHSADIDRLDGDLGEIGQHHEVGPPPAGDHPEVVAAQPDRIIDGGAADGLQRIEAIADEPPQHVAHPSPLDQMVGKDVIGAHRQARGDHRQRVDGLDQVGQQIIVRAADLDRQSRAQLLQRVLA
jgi:hypothetical protein